MALTPNISVTQSVKGNVLTFNDLSNWVEEGLDPADYTRTIELYDNKDATGNLITTLTFSEALLTVAYNITEDKYYSAKYIADDEVNPPYVKIINFGTTNFEYAQLNKILSKGCGCGNKTNDDKARYGFIFTKLAEKSVLFGNAGQFNQNIQKAATWLI